MEQHERAELAVLVLGEERLPVAADVLARPPHHRLELALHDVAARQDRHLGVRDHVARVPLVEDLDGLALVGGREELAGDVGSGLGRIGDGHPSRQPDDLVAVVPPRHHRVGSAQRFPRTVAREVVVVRGEGLRRVVAQPLERDAIALGEPQVVGGHGIDRLPYSPSRPGRRRRR